ncbi:PAS domain-containing protein [Quisquiliibacterium transsilvanicum]|uniref:PAS domain-containing protein n=1 Tax=Quisquiliibacterium transsilvanicum TaxID=1549638 RepID=A0A7W8HHB9_9BURK|nr:PAS domain-containing protein [Quisquiliibacterium transsilvanicum]MBB5272049.1 PAS domain-containing protein [Quisquiliibacterium transsilvanicum]
MERRVNVWGLVAVALLLSAFGLVLLDERFDNELQSLPRVRMDAVQVAGELRVRVGVLTDFSRQYAATGNPVYLRYYETEVAIHEGRAPAPPEYSGRFWYLVMAGEVELPPWGVSDSFEQRVARMGFTEGERAELARAVQGWLKLRAIEQAALAGLFSEPGGATGRFVPALHDAAYVGARADALRPLETFLVSVGSRVEARTAALLRSKRLAHAGLMAAALGLAASLVAVLWLLRSRLLRPLETLDGWMQGAGAAGVPRSLGMLQPLARTLERSTAEVDALVGDREQLIRALRQADARFARLAAQVRELAFECRLDPVLHLPRFSYVSPRARDVLGIEPDALMAEPECLAEAMPPEDLRALRDSVERALACGGPLELTLRVRSPADGLLRAVRLQAVATDERRGRHAYAGAIRPVDREV